MVQKKLGDKYIIDPASSVSHFKFEGGDKGAWPSIEIHFERTFVSRWSLTLERSSKKVTQYRETIFSFVLLISTG